jgi:hypothetical protein
MNRLIMTLLHVLFLARGYCQENKKNLDLILVVDGNIAVGSISSLKIELNDSGKTITLEPSYYPGNLSMNVSDYAMLMGDSASNILLKFTFYEYVNQKQKYYNYEIELKKPWLTDYFNILYIYNLNKERYKGKLKPVAKGKNYNFELQSPSHSFRLVHEK